MKYKISFFIVLLMVSCTSNTMYDEPDNVIPKDTMELLLYDMYLANAAKNIKDKSSKKRKNYLPIVFQKYMIDSTRFNASNIYYTSKIEDYNDILSSVKNRLENKHSIFETEINLKDSLKKEKKIKKRKLKEAQKKAKLSSVPFMLQRIEETPFYDNLDVYQSYIKEYKYILSTEELDLIENKKTKSINKGRAKPKEVIRSKES